MTTYRLTIHGKRGLAWLRSKSKSVNVALLEAYIAGHRQGMKDARPKPKRKEPSK